VAVAKGVPCHVLALFCRLEYGSNSEWRGAQEGGQSWIEEGVKRWVAKGPMLTKLLLHKI
jgi:hypothetical protein